MSDLDPTLIEDGDQEIAGKEDLSKLNADGKMYDLNNPAEVSKLIKKLDKARADLKTKKLTEYEDKSTGWGKGGRAELLRDQIVADLAQKRLNGRNDLGFDDMKRIAEAKASQVAKMRKAQGRF